MDVDFSSQPGFSAAQQQQPQAPLCGFFVQGGPVRTDFVPADPTGLKRTLTLQSPGDLPNPLASVTEVVCFLWPSAPLPPDHGVMIYWQISGLPASAGQQPPPSTGFELLGALTPTEPSKVLRTGWSEHEQLLDIMSRNIPVVVTFGLSVEPLHAVNNIQPPDRTEHRLIIAKRIAQDLFRYMQSFDTGGAVNTLQVPTNIFDRWMHRFETRFRIDPNFFLKQHQDDD